MTHEPHVFVTSSVKPGLQWRFFFYGSLTFFDAGEGHLVQMTFGQAKKIPGVSYLQHQRRLQIYVSREKNNDGIHCAACQDNNLSEEDAARCGMPLECTICQFQCHSVQAMQRHFATHSMMEMVEFLTSQHPENSTTGGGEETERYCKWTAYKKRYLF